MTMPLSSSHAQPFPIEVTENEWQFLVRIPANQKDRASRIPGRRWNPEIERWVYPKTLPAYESLTEEFKRDASVFDIRKPPSRRLPKPESQPHEDDQALEEWKDLNEKTSEIHGKFNGLEEQISVLLGSVRNVEAIARETQDLMRARPESPVAKTPAPPTTPPSLDLSKRDDLKVMQKALVLLAFAAAGRDQSFARWVGGYEPLLQPHPFVSETHEKIKSSVAAILGEKHHRRRNFMELATELVNREVYGPFQSKDIARLLYAMNQHRNRFSHPENFSEAEQISRSITYLFNLALAWPHVASEPIEETDEA